MRMGNARSIAAVLAVATSAVVLAGTAPVAADPADLPGRILTTKGRSETSGFVQQVISVDPTGGDRQVLLETGVGNSFSSVAELAWSPDGSKVAFTGRGPGDGPIPDIWVMDADGSNVTQLTDDPNFDTTPTWSPDGTTIAFLSDRDSQFDIWSMAADGSGEAMLHDWSDPDHPLRYIAWHPTDDVLLLGVGLDLHTLAVGGDPVLLAELGGSDMSPPRWSPDGTQIAVPVETSGFEADVFLVDAGDGAVANLSASSGVYEAAVDWSPDGAALVWTQFTGFFSVQTVVVHELDGGVRTPILAPADELEAFSGLAWGLPADGDGGESVSVEAEADEAVGTDGEGDGATPADPVETSLTPPVAGTVTIDEAPVDGTAPAGYSFFGQQVTITAPPGTAEDPITVSFRIDASVLPVGETAASVVVFRNGSPLPACTGAEGVAAPDPCLASAVDETDGDITLTVLTSAASIWNVGLVDDEEPPSITLTAPAHGATYGRGQVVVAEYSCSDDGAGIATCAGPVADGVAVPTGTTGPASFTVAAADLAGNTSSATATYEVTERRRLVPIVTCVARVGGSRLVARFGYWNRNPYVVGIDVGSSNRFTTAPADRGQPEVFDAGLVTRAFEVGFNGKISWRLDGTTVTAGAGSRRC